MVRASYTSHGPGESDLVSAFWARPVDMQTGSLQQEGLSGGPVLRDIGSETLRAGDLEAVGFVQNDSILHSVFYH